MTETVTSSWNSIMSQGSLGSHPVSVSNLNINFPDVHLKLSDYNLLTVENKSISFYTLDCLLEAKSGGQVPLNLVFNNCIIEFRGSNKNRPIQALKLTGEKNVIFYSKENNTEYDVSLQHTIVAGYRESFLPQLFGNTPSTNSYRGPMRNSVIYNDNNIVYRYKYCFGNNTYHLPKDYTSSDQVPLRIYSYKNSAPNGDAGTLSDNNSWNVYMGGCTINYGVAKIGFVFELWDKDHELYKTHGNSVAILSDICLEGNTALETLPVFWHPLNVQWLPQ